MLQQLSIDWNGISLHPENNKESEETLLEQEERLSDNCKKIYNALKNGRVLTGMDIIKMGMTEYRRRIKDLKEKGIDIKEKKMPNGCKAWYLETEKF